MHTASAATLDPALRAQEAQQLRSTLSTGQSTLAFASALDNFFAALAAHQADPSLPAVRILQFGDSHTAADMFTGEARRLMQAEFGNGGVGYTYPGHPFAGYRVLGSQRSQSAGWTTMGTHFADLGDARLGMAGLALATSHAGDTITLHTTCRNFSLDYLRQPGGGAVEVTDNGMLVGQISTAAAEPGAGQFRYRCATDSAGKPIEHGFTVTTVNDSPVRLFGTETVEPGVTWEALGLNSAEAPLMLRWDQPIFTSLLAGTSADLVVLAYGTNEAAAAHWTYEAYTSVFTRLVDTLHATLPQANILVLGPMDRSTSTGFGYAPFNGTERIIAAQREVCRTHHCAFWNAQERMGGLGAMQHWVYAAWAQHDHTHLNATGYGVLADALVTDLLRAYDSYRLQGGLPPATHPGTAPSTLPAIDNPEFAPNGTPASPNTQPNTSPTPQEP